MKRILVFLLAALMVLSAAGAARVEGDVTGRVEQSACWGKGYDGTGVLRIAAPAGDGLGVVLVRSGRIVRTDGADAWYYPDSDTWRVFFRDGEAGEVHVAGQVDASVIGPRPSVSSRGRFHVWNGPRGPCWEEWPLR